MKGARLRMPVTRSLFPAWDLALVLDVLTRPPFEPLESVELKILSYKTILLVALTTAKRVSDIHALSVCKECMRFEGNKVVLKPNPAFLPKNHLLVCTQSELMAFHPPPFVSEADKRLHCLCPVRALRLYVQRTETCRSGPRSRGKAVVKSTLSQWIVEAVPMAYTLVVELQFLTD